MKQKKQMDEGSRLYFRCLEGGLNEFHLAENEMIIIKRRRPELFGNIHQCLWRLLTLFCGEYWIYELWRGEKKISSAEVITWIPMFLFMPKKGIHIGPCITMFEERGKGYYPYLLSAIMKRHLGKDFYMIIRPENVASIRGVKKVGFEQFAEGRRIMFGFYYANKG